MKICIIRHAYFPEDPTVRKEVHGLIDAGYAVDIICLRHTGQVFHEIIKGAMVYRIPLSHGRVGVLRYFLEYFLSFMMITIVLLFLFLWNLYDCVQVNTMPDCLVFSTVLPKLLGAKILLHLHEPTPEVWLAKYGQKRLRWLLHLQTKIEQQAIRYADHCLTVTETLRRRFGERGADVEKITVIPNVCEEETFCTDAYSKRPVSDGTFCLITHGLIEKRYGHEIVIRAVNMLREKLPKLRFEILGEGEHKPKVAGIVQKLKCEERIQLLGFVPTDELLRRLHDADVGVVAMEKSPYSELIDTTKMYEYIALRKPIIISRLRAVEENFDDSCMMFFEPGNYNDLARCILELYYNPEKRQEIAENAYRHYEKIRWRETKKIYLRVIHNLIGDRKR